MKKLFPKGVTVSLGRTPVECLITDIETGMPVDNVVAVKLDLDAATAKRPRITLVLEGVRIKVEGAAEYEVDEATLRVLAGAQGFDLIPRG